MKVGMLWFDNDVKTELQAKVARAAAYYRQKYGQTPTLCIVHPSMLDGDRLKSGEVEIRTAPSIRPHHFWLGVNGRNSSKNGSTNGHSATA